MRIGVFGDVHGNLAALESVLAALDGEECDQLVCTGDVVGYGPYPAECIAALRSREIPTVLGNHDKYATMLVSARLDRLKPETRRSIEWTRSVLGMDDLRWLANLPVRLDMEGFTVIHGSFGPNRWAYLVNRGNLQASFAHQDVGLALSGHSHLPVLCYQDAGGEAQLGFLKTTLLQRHDKTMINPGSVGQPRDRDPRAACAVYDTTPGGVRLLRLEYDVEATRNGILGAGLPQVFASRLLEGR